MYFVAKKGVHDVFIHINAKQGYTFDEFYKYMTQKKSVEPLMITNGGMFKTTFAAQGLLVCESKKISELDTSNTGKEGNFYMQPNGVFVVDAINGFEVLKTSPYKEKYSNKKI